MHAPDDWDGGDFTFPTRLLDVAAYATRDCAKVVGDDGDGIPAGYEREILRRGARADTAAVGQGLGLSIVREILNRHGCDIEAQSEPGAWTRMSFTLPLAAEQARIREEILRLAQRIEEREKPGTPGVLQTMKAALVFQIKDRVGVDTIHSREHEFTTRAMDRWREEDGIEIFYFSSFDETWKVDAEGDVGAYWGLWDKDGHPKFV